MSRVLVLLLLLVVTSAAHAEPSKEEQAEQQNKKKPTKAPPKPLAWQLPAALAAGGVAVVAFGLSIGFGVHSIRINDRLEEECAPRCRPEYDADIEEGERSGVIANVSLAVGLVAVATGVAFVGWYLAETADGSTAVAVGPGHAVLRTRF